MGKCTKDKRDIYYRSAKQEGWRARSAFKLLHIDKSHGGKIFKDVKRAVDLCAAPGSWSQVLSQQVYLPNQHDPAVKVVAVDFQFMIPIQGVTQLQGDITEYSTAKRVLEELQGTKADLVVCDGAPDVTGFHDLDIVRHQDIVVAGLAITSAILKEGGTLVMKVFKRPNDELLGNQLSMFFTNVTFAKPEGSRDSSLEHFAVCFDHFCPSNYRPEMLLEYLACKSIEPFRNTRIPFVVYGDTRWSPEMQAEHITWTRRRQNRDSRSDEPVRRRIDETVEKDLLTDVEIRDNDGLYSGQVGDQFTWKSTLPPLSVICAKSKCRNQQTEQLQEKFSLLSL